MSKSVSHFQLFLRFINIILISNFKFKKNVIIIPRVSAISIKRFDKENQFGFIELY